MTVDGPERLLTLLLQDAVDLIFTHSPIRDRAIEVLASAAQPCARWSRPTTRSRKRKSVRLHDCVAYPIAMPDETLAARAFLDDALHRASITLDPALVSNSVETTKIFARTRQGVCFSFHIGHEARRLGDGGDSPVASGARRDAARVRGSSRSRLAGGRGLVRRRSVRDLRDALTRPLSRPRSTVAPASALISSSALLAHWRWSARGSCE